MVTSLGCMVHCLGLPLLIVQLPAWRWLLSPEVHWALLAVVLASAAGGLAPGVFQHRCAWVAIVAALGAGLVSFATIAHLTWLRHLPALTGLCLVLGSLCLVVAHFWNQLLSKARRGSCPR
jgi:hypothetical protein